ncbi:hypothetical protein DLH72_00105 [Candidatus Gracilibacteria bacterium]|nr:MAG: hypothetical protein DLH72_00105 [Candidatus Gracilibacteria bacterium]
MVNKKEIEKFIKELNEKIPEELRKNFVLYEGNEFALLPIPMYPFTRFIVHKIGIEKYSFNAKDILFLNNVDRYWNGKKDKISCEKAVEDYLNSNYNPELIDPYELVIDAFN